MNKKIKYKLLITIVKKGKACKIVEASKNAGAEGGTTFFGKGTGINEPKSFLGIPVEAEKEVVLSLVQEEKLDDVLDAVKKAGNLNKPGTGIGFVLDTKNFSGIVHQICQDDSTS